MSTASQQSSLRKLSDTGLVWPKLGGTYGFVDVATRCDTTVLFALAYNLRSEYLPSLGYSEIKKYLKLQGLPDVEGTELVGNNSCFANVEADVFVRSFSKKEWEKGLYHKVSMTNIVPNSSENSMKFRSVDSVGIKCDCARGVMQPSCRPPVYQRKMFGDNRGPNDVPGPFIRAVYCPHADIAHDWLSIFYDIHGFGMHMPNRTHDTIEYVVKQIVKKKQKLPKWRINLEFQPERKDIFRPLIDMVWKNQISPE
jgi:hypothetical protein